MSIDRLPAGILRVPLLEDGAVDREKLPKQDGRALLDEYGLGSFLFGRWDKPPEIFDAEKVPKQELRDPKLFGAYVAKAFEANRAYFIAPPNLKPLESLPYHGRYDSFVREAVALVRSMWPAGLERDRALDEIDRVVGPTYPVPELFLRGDVTPLRPAVIQDKMMDLSEPSSRRLTPDWFYSDQPVGALDLERSRPRVPDQVTFGSLAVGGPMSGLFVESITGREANTNNGVRSSYDAEGVKLSLKVTLRQWDAEGAIRSTEKNVVLDFTAKQTEPVAVEIRMGTESGKATEVLIDAAKRQVIERSFEMVREEGGRYRRVDTGEVITSFANQEIAVNKASLWMQPLFFGNHDEERLLTGDPGRLDDLLAIYRTYGPQTYRRIGGD